MRISLEEAVPSYRTSSAEQQFSGKEANKFLGLSKIGVVLCTDIDCSRLCTLLMGRALAIASSARTDPASVREDTDARVNAGPW